MQPNAASLQPHADEPRCESVDLSRVALLLDVDGTILDIAPTPYEVIVPPSLRAALA